MANNLKTRVLDLYRTLSKGQKRIANLILHDSGNIFDAPVRRLAVLAKVSESTVIRFYQMLGYAKYSDFQNAISDLATLTSSTSSAFLSSKSSRHNKNLLEYYMSLDIKSIKASLDSISIKEFNAFVSALLNSDRIYTVSTATTYPIAQSLQRALEYSSYRTYNIDKSSNRLLAFQLSEIKESDSIVVFDFCEEDKINEYISSFAKSNNIPLLLISSPDSSIASFTTHQLICKIEAGDFGISLVALTSLINALCAEIAKRNERSILERMNKCDAIERDINLQARRRGN